MGSRPSLLLLIGVGSLLASAIFIAGGRQASQTLAAPGPSHFTSGTYTSKRPSLDIKLVVRGQKIVYRHIRALETCIVGENTEGYVYSGIRTAYPIIRINRMGRFAYRETNGSDGNEILSGRIKANTITGSYRSFTYSESAEFVSQTCGTGGSPQQGRATQFTARRVP
jgi:hypothetical protein